MASTWDPTQRVYPYLFYADVDAALAFLRNAFGFETTVHAVDPSDRDHVHAEVALGGTTVMVGKARDKWGTASVRECPGPHAGVFVVVDDVDGHHRRARAAGARIDAEPADMPWGARMYTARDAEGQVWYFATPRRTRPA
ncbi:MAG TPA: VOC family protein [Candidatus Binatia bacterium]|nr:VOC family protein [Candidatus Binatia bacterium]